VTQQRSVERNFFKWVSNLVDVASRQMATQRRMEKGFPQTWQPPQIQETKKYRNQATFLSKNVDCSLELLIS
jgi:hypothetical protein